jgi:hypothetical protein
MNDEERAARKIRLLLSEIPVPKWQDIVMDRTAWNKMLRSIYTKMLRSTLCLSDQMRQQQGIGTQSDKGLGCGYGSGSGYGGSDPQGMPLTGNAPWGKRPLRPPPPRVRSGRNQAAVQKVCVYLF